MPERKLEEFRARLISDLEQLPEQHLKFLYGSYEIAAKRNRTPALAEMLLNAEVVAYPNFNLRQTSGSLTWYRVEQPWNPEAILVRFLKANPAYGTALGARPVLPEDGMPQINRVFRVESTRNRDDLDEIVVELAALDTRRKYRLNWESRTILTDHDYRLTIKGTPTTIEVRSAGERTRAIIAPVAQMLGIEVPEPVLIRDDAEMRLKSALKARSTKGYIAHTHLTFSRSTIEGRDNVDLQTTDDHKKFIDDTGGDEFAHAYVFNAPWPDGYREKVGYKIDRGTGLLSIRTHNTSEIALEYLRKHVLAL